MEEKEIVHIKDDYKKFYEKKGLLGKGQYGKVYKGMNKETKEMRAIKVMEIYDEEDKFMNLINNELNNMKICSNKNENSVKIYECFHFEHKFTLVMELCDNSLQKILDEKKEGFTCEEIYDIKSQLNNTFKIMYENKIIHRDIKLDNIVVKYIKENKDSKINFIVKLTDYGVSKQLMTTIGKTYAGTALTMAPEIIGGDGVKDYGNKCDLWSIGIIIYQLFFKDYPYKGLTPVAVYNQIKNLGNKLLKSTQNNILDNLIRSLLIKEPSKRINYEQYFNHPFFKPNLYNNKINSNIIYENKIEEKNKKIKINDSLKQFYKKKLSNNDKNSFYIHIKIIGSNMEKFYDELKKSNNLANIIKFWDIDKLEDSNVNEQLNKYFYHLNKIILEDKWKTKDLREVLILKINNIFDPEFSILLTKMDELYESGYMLLVLLLTENNSKEKLVIDTEKFKNIDERLIIICQYTEHPEKMEEDIFPLLLRFCSIHNELGDSFSIINGKNEVNYDLIENIFPYNIYISCLGKTGEGKSAGVNALLQEYKSKEGCNGRTTTKNTTLYQVKNLPIRILDTQGIENLDTIKKVSKIYKQFCLELNEKNAGVNIILYFFNYYSETFFMSFDYQILEEITNYKNTKIIYVFTHSKPNFKRKKKRIDAINNAIRKMIENTPLTHHIEMLKANDNNVVFVNFHKNIEDGIEPFGKKELFQKIHDYLIKSGDYLDNLNDNKITENALRIRTLAEKELSPGLVGGIANSIPIFGRVFQKYYINKNSIKKVAEIYGIDIKSIEDNKDLEGISSFEQIIDIFDKFYKNKWQCCKNAFEKALEYFLLKNEK